MVLMNRKKNYGFAPNKFGMNKQTGTNIVKTSSKTIFLSPRQYLLCNLEGKRVVMFFFKILSLFAWVHLFCSVLKNSAKTSGQVLFFKLPESTD